MCTITIYAQNNPTLVLTYYDFFKKLKNQILHLILAYGQFRGRPNSGLMGRFGFPWVPFRLNQKVREHSLNQFLFAFPLKLRTSNLFSCSIFLLKVHLCTMQIFSINNSSIASEFKSYFLLNHDFFRYSQYYQDLINK